MNHTIGKTLALCMLLFCAFSVSLPVLVRAQTTPPAPSEGYHLLVSDLPFISGVPEGASLAPYLNAFYRLGIAIAILLAVVLFVYNGVRYMTSDVIGSKEESKKAFIGIVGGLVLIFASYIILNAINPALVNFKLFDTLSEVSARLGGQPATTPPATAPTSDEVQAREQLKLIGVGVNHDACPGPSGYGCTNLAGMPGPVFTFLGRMSSDLGGCAQAQWPACTVIITSGTESNPGATHGPGRPYVDIARNSSVDMYLINRSSPPQDTSAGKLYAFKDSQIWALDEGSGGTGPHWHLCIGAPCRISGH
jgi:hypothetical protein